MAQKDVCPKCGSKVVEFDMTPETFFGYSVYNNGRKKEEYFYKCSDCKAHGIIDLKK